MHQRSLCASVMCGGGAALQGDSNTMAWEGAACYACTASTRHGLPHLHPDLLKHPRLVGCARIRGPAVQEPVGKVGSGCRRDAPAARVCARTCKLNAHIALVAAKRHGMQRACQQNALASRGDSVHVITKSSCRGCCAGYAISCLHAVKVPDNHVSGGSQRCTVAKSTAEHSRLPVKPRPFVPSSSHAPAPAPEL